MRMRFLCFSVIQYLFSCLSKISELPDFLILNFKNDLKIKLSDKDISFLSCIHFASHIQEPCVLWMKIVAKAIKWVFMSLTKACPAKILANKCIRGCYPHKSIDEYFISDVVVDIIGFLWSCFFCVMNANLPGNKCHSKKGLHWYVMIMVMVMVMIWCIEWQ